jgi:hypothetical protein
MMIITREIIEFIHIDTGQFVRYNLIECEYDILSYNQSEAYFIEKRFCDITTLVWPDLERK